MAAAAVAVVGGVAKAARRGAGRVVFSRSDDGKSAESCLFMACWFAGLVGVLSVIVAVIFRLVPASPHL